MFNSTTPADLQQQHLRQLQLQQQQQLYRQQQQQQVLYQQQKFQKLQNINQQYSSRPGQPNTPKQKHGFPVKNGTTRIIEEPEVPDDSEIVTERSVASERFRRSNAYMNEIFSSYATASIVKVSIVDFSEKNISNLKIIQKKLKDEIELLKAKLSK